MPLSHIGANCRLQPQFGHDPVRRREEGVHLVPRTDGHAQPVARARCVEVAGQDPALAQAGVPCLGVQAVPARKDEVGVRVGELEAARTAGEGDPSRLR